MIELRLDSLLSSPELHDFCSRHQGKIPLLMTARDPLEGGQNSLSGEKRRALQFEFLEFASAIDLEFANFEQEQELIEQVREKQISLILSAHNFESFEHSIAHENLTNALSAGADIAKVAVHLKDTVDLTLFESLCAELCEEPVALMGMGPLGPVSRVLAAQHRSRLNYGYLGQTPTAPGQWPAPLLKEAVAHSPLFAEEQS